MSGNVIGHMDANSFYVSCEMCYNPGLRGKAVVVGGDVEARHGIVLAKSDKAKAAGIQTGHILHRARQLCPGLIILPPNYRLYLHFSRKLRALFGDYTDRVEPFGLDEAFIDLSRTVRDFSDGEKLANRMRERAKAELGISVSIGVANNKIMAKLGSDYKKPDAVTLLSPEDYPKKVWPLPVGELLYVGHATAEKLRRWGIFTIGDLAKYPVEKLETMLGKVGTMIWTFANGLDTSTVAPTGASADMKSIGNSTTTPRDLLCEGDVKMTVYLLAESVAERLRAQGFRGRTVELWIRDNELRSFTRQKKLTKVTYLSGEIAEAAMDLFRANYDFAYQRPIRSVGVRATDLVTEHSDEQLSFFEEDETRRMKREHLEHSIDDIRTRFGHFAIQRGMMIADRKLTNLNPATDHHQIFPVAYHK